MAKVDAGYVTLRNTGGSLPVENVQSLAASKNLREIPERYIRPELETDTILDGDGDGNIPIIDLRRLLDAQDSRDEVTKLGLACEEWGFFQLVNHGVPGEVIETMKGALQAFFQLPLEQKKAYAQPPGSVEGYGQAFVLSEEQKLDWGDMFFLGTLPVFTRNMELWPASPSTFSTALDKYSLELKRVADVLFAFIGKSLGAESFADQFKDCQQQTTRMNYYPPCPHASKVLGISPHSDSAALTLLLQVNEVQGLQIKRSNGWVPVKPLHAAFTVNIGDIVEIMTNGRYKSIEHRAVINPENERMSIATFHVPKFDGHIGPLPELVKENMHLYKTITGRDYLRLVFSHKLQGKKILDHMKMTN